MGGSKGGGGKAPEQAQPLDYAKLMAAANEQAWAASRSQVQSQVEFYPQLEALQLGTVRTIADNLNNGYTASANNLIGSAMAQRGNIEAMAGNVATQASNVAGQAGNVAGVAPRIGRQADNISDLGSGLTSFGTDQLARSGPNSLEQSLYDQTAGDLALGSRLNAEEERAASQSARGAFSARGLGVGPAAAAAEIINRHQFGQARLARRQGAAINANNAITQNVIARQGVGLGALGQAGSMFANAGTLLGSQANVYGQAGGLYGQSGGLFGNAGSLYNQSAQLALAGANAYLSADPYQRALGAGSSFSGANLNNSSGMIGNTYNAANQMAGNVASFNANMLDSRYNSYQNNQAAMNAANSAMWGQIGGAALGAVSKIGSSAAMAAMCWVAREIYGEENPAWIEFRNWLLTRGSYRRVSRYAMHGPRIAEYISTRPGWKARLRAWMDRCRAELSQSNSLQPSA